MPQKGGVFTSLQSLNGMQQKGARMFASCLTLQLPPIKKKVTGVLLKKGWFEMVLIKTGSAMTITL